MLLMSSIWILQQSLADYGTRIPPILIQLVCCCNTLPCRDSVIFLIVRKLCSCLLSHIGPLSNVKQCAPVHTIARDCPEMGLCQAQNFVTSTRLRQQLHLLQAEAFTEANIVDVSSYKELKAAVAERKWARGHWAGRSGQLVLLFSAQKFWINFWQSMLSQ